jgi:hypothetical protein
MWLVWREEAMAETTPPRGGETAWPLPGIVPTFDAALLFPETTAGDSRMEESVGNPQAEVAIPPYSAAAARLASAAAFLAGLLKGLARQSTLWQTCPRLGNAR